MMRVMLTTYGVLGHTVTDNWTVIIFEVMATFIIIGMILWLLLFYRKRTSAIIKHLETIEKETKKIEDSQVNNTVSLSDIHGIVSSIDEKQPFHKPHNQN